MSQPFAAWGIIVLALISANMPFLHERVLMLFTWRRKGVPTIKPLWLRVLEWLVLYFLVGGVSVVLEGTSTRQFSDTWQFYVITLCLFSMMAFPGFVARYLWRSSS